MTEEVRVDKWLWVVRIFKTRSESTEACKKGHVLIDKLPVKPSRMLRPGHIVQVKKPPIERSYKVLGISEKRISAKLTEEFVMDITPPETIKLLEIQKNMHWIMRTKGTGRPTKKERRDIDDFLKF
jgi:ribosome-associated heat shock protein Hsp15